MEPFRRLTSAVVQLPASNIDTDQIIPAQFLKITDKAGLGAHLFAGWRYDEHGVPRPDFALNAPGAKDARVLVAGANFGCGSSREHAPWALVDFGFRAIVSPSIADIFKANALKNGLLPVVVDGATHERLLAATTNVTIDLESQTLTFDGVTATFAIDPFSRRCLLDGVDEMGYLVAQTDAIATFELSTT